MRSDNISWETSQPVNCETEKFTYMIECNKEKYKQLYIGEPKSRLAKRLSEHRGYMYKKYVSTKGTKINFNQCVYNVCKL